jgi:hypothetical protein
LLKFLNQKNKKSLQKRKALPFVKTAAINGTANLNEIHQLVYLERNCANKNAILPIPAEWRKRNEVAPRSESPGQSRGDLKIGWSIL